MSNDREKAMDLCVTRLEAHQKALKLSDVRFCARYQKHIGSPKTWRDRLCARDWKALGNGVEKWHRNLQALVSQIDGNVDLEEFFERLPIAEYGQRIFDRLQGSRNDRRVGWLIAPTGCGKSYTLLHLARENESAVAYIHINRGAKDSMMVIASQLARAVGATVEAGGARTYANVVESLRGNPMTLLIDDVHEGGVLCLKLLKHLVDDTRCKMILGTYPTAWTALVNGSTDAQSEAQQLMGRSLKPIEQRWLRGLTEEDVAAYLRLAMGGNGECAVVAQRIAPVLRRNGNLRALSDAVEAARTTADDDGSDLDLDLIEEAVHVLCPAGRREANNGQL